MTDDGILEGLSGEQLVAGVFIDPVTGNIAVRAAPNMDPILVFADAIRAVEMQRLAAMQDKPQIAVPRGPLPKLR